MWICILFIIVLRPPTSTRTDPLFPYTSRFRSAGDHVLEPLEGEQRAGLVVGRDTVGFQRRGDLVPLAPGGGNVNTVLFEQRGVVEHHPVRDVHRHAVLLAVERVRLAQILADPTFGDRLVPDIRSEEHTSELQSLMRISYAVFCLKKKKKKT